MNNETFSNEYLNGSSRLRKFRIRNSHEMKSRKTSRKIKLLSKPLFLSIISISLSVLITITILRAKNILSNITTEMHDLSDDRIISVSGLFISVLGVLLTLVIYEIVKEETTKSDQEFNQKILKINDTVKELKSASNSINGSTKEILNSTKEILDSYTSLREVTGFTKRLEVIEGIFDLSENENNNDLYVMTHSVNYGNILAHQFNTLCEDEAKINNVSNFPDLYAKVMFSNLDKISVLLNRLGTLAEKVTLKLLFFDVDKYENMLERVSNRHDIKLFAKIGRQENMFNYSNQKEEFKGSYLRWVKDRDLDILEKDVSAQKKYFIEKLNEYNENSLFKLIHYVERRLNKSTNSSIATVAYLPFQFIASVPKENGPGDRKCLVIFTNMYGDEEKIVDTITCFESENKNLIDNLINIFEHTYSADKKQKENKEYFRNFFCFKKPDEISILMRSTKVITDPEDNHEHSFLYDDIIAEQSLRRLFAKHKFLLRNELISSHDYFNINSETKCIISFGLFGNHLTEKVIKYLESRGILKLSIIDGKKTIESRLNVSEKNRFSSNYSFNNQESYDFALFAKVKFDGITAILCGGCEGYGTQMIGKFIFKTDEQSKESEQWYNITAPNGLRSGDLSTNFYADPEFISIFKIQAQPNHSIANVVPLLGQIHLVEYLTL